MRSASSLAPALLSVLLLALTTAGCSHDGRGLAEGIKTQPKPRVSQTSRPKAPEKPASGLGGPASVPERVSCPDLPTATYEALAQPTVLPDKDRQLDAWATRKWIEGLEGQVGWLRAHLGDTINSYNKCLTQIRP
jgi:hypothetical protein